MKNHLLIKPNWFKAYKLDRDNAIERGQEIDAASLADRLAALRDIYSVDGAGSAHIRITGPLSNEGPDMWDVFLGYGGTAYPDVRDAVLRAQVETEEERPIFLDIDTPGGSVFGLDETYQDIFAASEDRKVVANVHGMAASAGYYIASAANEIHASSPASMVGSIGVAITAVDYSGALDAEGIEIVTMTNDESPDKRPDLSTDDGRAVIRKELNDLFDVFAGRVVQGRGEQRADFNRDTITNLRGSTVLANEGVQIGLVDVVHDKTRKAAPIAVQTTNEVIHMNLQELLAANPEAAAELDSKLTALSNQPAPVEADDTDARIDAASAVLASAVYPETVKAVASKVLKGACDLEALNTAVAVFDAMTEAHAADVVAEADLPETPADPQVADDAPSASGKTEKPEDINATIAALARIGL